MTTEFVDPQSIHNPAAGSKPPASWGDTVRDDLVALGAPPLTKVYRTTDQTGIVTATWTAVAFDTEYADTDAFHSTTTNNSRITVPAGMAGTYYCQANFPWDGNTSGSFRQLAIRANGVSHLATVLSAPTAYVRQFVAVDVPLSVGDYIEAVVVQDSGANRSSGIDATGKCWFSARLVAWS
jgi:hypothetical protein